MWTDFISTKRFLRGDIIKLELAEQLMSDGEFAFDENKNARLALTAMGAVNPLIAVFGRFATKNQEKNIQKTSHL